MNSAMHSINFGIFEIVYFTTSRFGLNATASHLRRIDTTSSSVHYVGWAASSHRSRHESMERHTYSTPPQVYRICTRGCSQQLIRSLNWHSRKSRIKAQSRVLLDTLRSSTSTTHITCSIAHVATALPQRSTAENGASDPSLGAGRRCRMFASRSYTSTFGNSCIVTPCLKAGPWAMNSARIDAFALS